MAATAKYCKEKKGRYSKRANKRQRTHYHNALSPKNKSKRYNTKHGTPNAQSKLDAEKNPNTRTLQGAKVPCRYCRSIDNMILMQASLMWEGFPDSIVQDEPGIVDIHICPGTNRLGLDLPMEPNARLGLYSIIARSLHSKAANPSDMIIDKMVALGMICWSGIC
jgi:hypothetical protein